MKLDQRKIVLQHLRDHGTITSMQAFGEYQITRLSSCIFDLRKMGYDISTTLKTAKNQYGTTQYAEYRLEGEQ